MTDTRVLDPATSYAELAERWRRAGWQLVDQASAPILPEEPEYAVFERRGARVVYTFNPVCRLRVLDVSGLPDEATLPELPLASTGDVLGWLADDDERAVLRGVLAAGQLGDPDLAEPVSAHRDHPRRAIADAAAQASAVIEAAALRVQAQAFAAIDVLRERLTPLLRALAHDPGLAETFRPQPGDCERAFVPAVVESARAAYERLWGQPPRLGPAAGRNHRIECQVAPAGMLGYDNQLSRGFPGGYRGIAHLLDPQRVWVAWKVIESDRSAGTGYDGLVWLDDHWAWFPKPYRVLRDVATPR